MIEPLLAATTIDSETLTTGLFVGALAVLVSAILAVWLPSKRPGVIGIPMAVAAVVTLRRQLGSAGFPVGIIAAAVLFAAAAEFLARTKMRHSARWAALLPGATCMVLTPVGGVSIGTRISVAVGATVCTVAFSDFDRRHERDGMLIALLTVASSALILIAKGSIAGPAIVASVAPFCILLFPRPQARFGTVGSATAATAFWWTVALIANENGAWICAAWVALGFCLWEPAARTFLPKSLRPSRHNDRDSRWLVLATAVVAQAAAVAYATVVTANQTGVDIAMLTVLPALGVGVLGATAVVPTPRRRKPRSSELDRI